MCVLFQIEKNTCLCNISTPGSILVCNAHFSRLSPFLWIKSSSTYIFFLRNVKLSLPVLHCDIWHLSYLQNQCRERENSMHIQNCRDSKLAFFSQYHVFFSLRLCTCTVHLHITESSGRRSAAICCVLLAVIAVSVGWSCPCISWWAFRRSAPWKEIICSRVLSLTHYASDAGIFRHFTSAMDEFEHRLTHAHTCSRCSICGINLLSSSNERGCVTLVVNCSWMNEDIDLMLNRKHVACLNY